MLWLFIPMLRPLSYKYMPSGTNIDYQPFIISQNLKVYGFDTVDVSFCYRMYTA